MTWMGRPDAAAGVTSDAAASAVRMARAARAVLWLACGAQFMVVLDVSVVNVALVSIRQSLGFDPVGLQWVSHGYTLVFAGLLLVGGRLADVYGPRRMFLLGLGAFSAASVLGGVAISAGMLVAARAGQGLGAAVLAPVTLTLLTATIPEGHRRTRAIAAWAAVSVAGGVAGNLLGGLITQLVSWRGILLVNVPLGVVGIIVAVRYVRRDKPARTGVRLDVPGAVLSTAALVSLTYGITRIEPYGWADPITLVIWGSSVVAMIGFVVVETRIVSAPLIPPRLLRLPAVSIGNTAMLLAGACFGAPMWYFLALTMQDVVRLDPLWTGLGFLPLAGGTLVITSRFTPWLMRRFRYRTLIVLGAAGAAAGFGWLAARLATGLADMTSYGGYFSVVLGPSLLIAVGGGLVNAPLTTMVTSGIPAGDAGAAAGIMNTAKQVGGALALAILITLAPGATAANYAFAFAGITVIMIVTALVAMALPSHRDRTAE